MAVTSPSDDAKSFPGGTNEKGVLDLAGEALQEIGTLLHTELQLLRAEISEKIEFAAMSAAFLGGGALLLVATIVLVLQAIIAGLVAQGLSLPIAILIVAAITLIAGAGLVWLGINRLGLIRLSPSKTVHQLQKDSNIPNTR